MLSKLRISTLPYPDKIFFIVGHPKSGTTWLSRMLDSHPQISCKYEGHFFSRKDGYLSLEDAISNSAQLKQWMDREFNHWIINKDEEVSVSVKLLIQYYFQRQVFLTGQKIVGDKSPSYYIEPIAKYFPDATIFHMVRDGRDVTVSMAYHRSTETDRYMSIEMTKQLDLAIEQSRKANKRLTLPLDFVAQMAETWAEEVSTCRTLGRKLFGAQYIEIRYEDIHRDSKDVLTQLLKVLDADASNDVVKYCVQASSFKELSGGRENGEESCSSFFRKGIVGDWANVSSSEQETLYTQIAGKQLIEFGYETKEKNDLEDNEFDHPNIQFQSSSENLKGEPIRQENNLQQIYDSSFFDEHREEKLVAARLIVPLVIDVLPVKSVVDVGCGSGLWLSIFQENGIEDIRGFDASDLPAEQYYIDKSHITTGCDFSVPSFLIDNQFDLAVCLEVAEHLPIYAADQLVSNLVNAAPFVLFSAAFPGQTGVEHINEQPPWYWREKFKEHGYVEIDFLRSTLWADGRVSWWYRQNITIYVHNDTVKCNHRIQKYFERYQVLPEPEHLIVVSERILRKQFVSLGTDLTNISVIIPTFNHSKIIVRALRSVLSQTITDVEYEVLVVDNNSTDDTKEVVEKFNRECGHRVRYVFEPIPGLLSARHRGAIEAKGNILVFCDDDIEASSNWLEAIRDAFEHPKVHLVGGPSLPLFEKSLPDWIIPYCSVQNGRITCGPLSLLDLGDRTVEVDPSQVWGLNYAIRKRTLFELGGFHPDGIPEDLLQFRGDGETGLSYKLKAKGYRALYHPEVKVYHHIPANRLSIEYFQKRFFKQGVSDSYTIIRKNGGSEGVKNHVFKPDDASIINQPPFNEFHRQIKKSYIDGFNFLLNAVRQSPRLMEWVLRSNYFDYRPPQLEEKPKQQNSNPINGSPLSKKTTLEKFSEYQTGHLTIKQYEETLLRFQKAVEKNPANAAAWAGIGQIAQQLDDERTAEAAFRRVYQLDPHQPALLDWIFPSRLRQTFDAAVSPHLQQDSGDYLFAPEEYHQPHQRLLDHYQVFAREISLNPPRRNFLEIGAGAGGVSYIAKKLGFEVIATDIGITDNQFDPQAASGPAARRVLDIDVVEFAVSPQNSLAQVVNFSNGQKADYIFMRGVQFNRKHIGSIRYANPTHRDDDWLEGSQWYTAEEWLPVLVNIFDNLNVDGRLINLAIFKLDQTLAQEIAGKLRQMLQDRVEFKVTIYPHPQWSTIADMWLTRRQL